MDEQAAAKSRRLRDDNFDGDLMRTDIYGGMIRVDFRSPGSCAQAVRTRQ
jgi:hypothetical protein